MMNIMKSLLLVAALLGASTCQQGDPAPQPRPTPSPDLVDVQCQAGFINLQKLSCDDAYINMGDGKLVTWADFCRYEESLGVDLRPDCIATLKTCPDETACPVGHKR